MVHSAVGAVGLSGSNQRWRPQVDFKVQPKVAVDLLACRSKRDSRREVADVKKLAQKILKAKATQRGNERPELQ